MRRFIVKNFIFLSSASAASVVCISTYVHSREEKENAQPNANNTTIINGTNNNNSNTAVNIYADLKHKAAQNLSIDNIKQNIHRNINNIRNQRRLHNNNNNKNKKQNNSVSEIYAKPNLYLSTYSHSQSHIFSHFSNSNSNSNSRNTHSNVYSSTQTQRRPQKSGSTNADDDQHRALRIHSDADLQKGEIKNLSSHTTDHSNLIYRPSFPKSMSMSMAMYTELYTMGVKSNLLKYDTPLIKTWLLQNEANIVPDSIVICEVPECGQKFLTFVSIDPLTHQRYQYFSFRGTKNLKNVYSSMQMELKYNAMFEMYLHSGYAHVSHIMYKSIAPYIDPECVLRFTGHSLGGVICCCIANYLHLLNAQARNNENNKRNNNYANHFISKKSDGALMDNGNTGTAAEKQKKKKRNGFLENENEIEIEPTDAELATTLSLQQQRMHERREEQREVSGNVAHELRNGNGTDTDLYNIDQIVTFGMPQFASMQDMLELSENLPLIRVEHIKDKISRFDWNWNKLVTDITGIRAHASNGDGYGAGAQPHQYQHLQRRHYCSSKSNLCYCNEQHVYYNKRFNNVIYIGSKNKHNNGDGNTHSIANTAALPANVSDTNTNTNANADTSANATKKRLEKTVVHRMSDYLLAIEDHISDVC